MTLGYPCNVCALPTTMWCSRCHRAWYCSQAHLQADWPRHYNECVGGSAGSSTMPLTQIAGQSTLAAIELVTVAALLFSPESERPHLVSVHCQIIPGARVGTPPMPIVQPYFNPAQPQSAVLTQGLSGDALRFPLHVFFCPLSLQNGAPINRAVATITSGAAPRPWAGVVVVLKFSGSRRSGYIDAGNNDLPALSAFFMKYGE